MTAPLFFWHERDAWGEWVPRLAPEPPRKRRRGDGSRPRSAVVRLDEGDRALTLNELSEIHPPQEETP